MYGVLCRVFGEWSVWAIVYCWWMGKENGVMTVFFCFFLWLFVSDVFCGVYGVV